MPASRISFRPFDPGRDQQQLIEFFGRARASWLDRGHDVDASCGYPLQEVATAGSLQAARLGSNPTETCDWICTDSAGELLGIMRTRRRAEGPYPWRFTRILFDARHDKSLPGTVAVALVLHLRQAHQAIEWGFGDLRSEGGAKVVSMMRVILPLKGVNLEPPN